MMIKNKVLAYAFFWSIVAHVVLLFCFRIKMFDIPELEPLNPISVLLEKEGVEVLQKDAESPDDLHQPLLAEALCDVSWSEYQWENSKKNVENGFNAPALSMDPAPFFPIAEKTIIQSTPDFIMERAND